MALCDVALLGKKMDTDVHKWTPRMGCGKLSNLMGFSLGERVT